MKYFSFETSPDGKYLPQLTEVCFNHCFNGIHMKSSWLVLYARIFNLNYIDFLRMVRDVYGATLKGKEGGYIYFYFNEKMMCERFVKDVNKRFETWMKF
jgi:hypothetical protein